MKIVFLNPTAEVGGAERSMLDIFASLRAANPDDEIELVVSGDGPLIEQATRAGVRTEVLPFPTALAQLGDSAVSAEEGRVRRVARPLLQMASASPALAGYAANMRRYLRKSRPDVIHTNGFKMHVLGARARPPRSAVVWHIHDFVTSRALMSRLLRTQAGRCDGVIANSKSVAADAAKLVGETLRIDTVYNAVDLERFNPVGPTIDLDALAGIARPVEGTLRVGLVATMGHWKGHEVFLRALAQLPPDIPPVRGYVVSGALYETKSRQFTIEGLRALAAELGITDRVAFTGFVRESPAAMRALDVVVHASTQPEPFGLVIVEAMACERAVIVAAAGGAAELIEPGVNALAHPPGDSATLALRIAELARDPSRRLAIARAGRRTAERDFDRSRLAGELRPIYERAIAHALERRR